MSLHGSYPGVIGALGVNVSYTPIVFFVSLVLARY